MNDRTTPQEGTMNKSWSRLGGLLGIAYCIAGVLLIFLGWNGAASNDRVQAQLPYVVSGGIGGLALVVIGAALIVSQSLRNDRVELRGGLDDLRQSIDKLSAGPTVVGTGAVATTSSPAGGSVVAGPTSYHRPGCKLVQGHPDALIMSRDEAAASDRTPCRVCNPDGTTLTAVS
jgi:hypothetical protein